MYLNAHAVPYQPLSIPLGDESPQDGDDDIIVVEHRRTTENADTAGSSTERWTEDMDSISNHHAARSPEDTSEDAEVTIVELPCEKSAPYSLFQCPNPLIVVSLASPIVLPETDIDLEAHFSQKIPV